MEAKVTKTTRRQAKRLLCGRIPILIGQAQSDTLQYRTKASRQQHSFSSYQQIKQYVCCRQRYLVSFK